MRNHRARGCCEWCGVQQYAVEKWIGDRFAPVTGGPYQDEMQYAQSYTKANEAASNANLMRDLKL